MHVEFHREFDMDHLKEEWSRLESQICPPPFLRWPWIATAIAQYRHNLFLARVRHGADIVALGLLYHLNTTRYKIVPSRQLYLHSFGHEGRCGVFAEHNGLLVDDAHRKGAWDTLLTGLKTSDAGAWDEFIIPYTTQEDLSSLGPAK